ncbi:MAG: cytochrome c, partial [Flavobacteriales bacterium]
RHDDFETIRTVSEELGTRGRGSSGLLKDAPDGFRQISKAMRSDFASLALAAEPGKTAELEDTFGAILLKCSSCHGSYRAASP